MDTYSNGVDSRLTYEKETYLPKSLKILFGVYIFLSFFETYLTRFIGSSTKFYLLGMILVYLLCKRFKIRLNIYSKMIIIWFLYKFLTIFWSNLSNRDVRTHLISQIGMVLFVVVITGIKYKAEFISYILRVNYWCSFVFGVLSLIFSKPFLSEIYAARQVLTLFGLQNDPNNCAAFLCIGYTISLYSLLYEQKKYVVNLIVFSINLLALLKTTSRAGLITVFIILVISMFLPVNKTNGRNNSKKIILITVMIIVGMFVAFNYLPMNSLERLLNFKDYEGGSGRTVRWSAAIKAFSKNPIFGCGWGGYVLEGFNNSSAIHNTFLTSLCDGGIVGTILLILPIFTLCMYAIRKKQNLVVLLLLSGIIPSIFIDAINKRFFWNAIVICILLIEYGNKNDEIWMQDCNLIKKRGIRIRWKRRR